nr:myosin-2 heavy chain-like isoform X1 [Danaus plexippus plexippus]
MNESNDVQALEKISSEVDESQFKIILTNQCIKAQEFLVHKLRRQSEQTRQICNFISSGNLKLESEIRLGEQEIKNLRSALETIKSSNVELEKELLLIKEDKIDLIERVNNGIRKYEELWLTSKQKYDNIPFIKKQQLTINRRKSLEDTVVCLDNEIQHLRRVFEERKKELSNIDRQHAIYIARYMVDERPDVLRCLTQKAEEVNNLMNEIKDLQNEQNFNFPRTNYSKVAAAVDAKTNDETVSVEKKHSDDDNEDAMLLPKLQLQNIDLDMLMDKLEQVKKADSMLIKRADSITIQIQEQPHKYGQENMNNIYVSSYFKNINDVKEVKEKVQSQTFNYTDKKLIHILEDIQLHKKDSYNIFSKLNPNELRIVDVIPASIDINNSNQSPEKLDKGAGTEVTKEIDLTNKDSSNIVIPPSQFLDLSQNSQEKKVKFSTVVSVQEVENMNKSQEYAVEENIKTELSTSVASENSYQIIKENIFKKHNIALSPEFIYSKNPKISDKKTKFCDGDDMSDKPTQIKDVCGQNMNTEVEVGASIDVVSKQEPTVAGFLFTHGPKGIPDSLDVSMASTCIEDVDNEFPHCFDSSLLLSPKADLKVPENIVNNTGTLSQEVPNFLSGFKKVGLSLFGHSSENNSDTNNKLPNANNFNFSFVNTEKRNRGGFFNMFN